jgi:hypothetical protein
MLKTLATTIQNVVAWLPTHLVFHPWLSCSLLLDYNCILTDSGESVLRRHRHKQHNRK